MLPALHLTQEAYGWLSPEALGACSDAIGFSPAYCQSVASFYDMFFLEPVGDARDRRLHQPRVRAVRRGRGRRRPSSEELGVRVGETTGDGAITLRKAECLGGCSWAPVVAVDERYRERVTPADVPQIVADARAARREGGMPEWTPRLEANVLLDFEGDLRDIAAYEAYGGYAQLRRAIEGMDAEGLIAELGGSALRGRGGAGFPTGRKASFLAPGAERYLVVNADESEPGSCKDRELMLRTPHALLEGILIVMNVLRLTRGYIYIRGEYLTESEVLEAAIAQARARGYVGAPAGDGWVPRDHGAPRRGRVHLRRGDGAALVAQRLPRPAEREAAVPRRVGRVRAADAAQQRRDDRDDPGDHAPRRRRVPRARHRAERRHARDVALGARAAARQLRGRR